MPRLLAPHKSGPHRLACLALFRSLLRESRHVGTATSSTTTADTLRSLVRYRFRKDRGLQSRPRIVHGLKAGHGFLDLLRGCAAKSPSAVDQLSKLLEQVALQAESTATYRRTLAARWKPPPLGRYAHLENLRRVRDKNNHVSTPSAPRIFQHPRPLSEVKTGVRKVPNLILAQGVPLLKYPGPTPVLVNRILKEKIRWGVRKWEQHKDVRRRIQIAEWEDEWDDILAEEGNFVDDDDGGAGAGADGLLMEGDEGLGSVKPHVSGTRIRYYDPQNEVADTASATGASRKQQPGSGLKPRLSWTTHLRQVDRELELAVMERGKQYALLGNRYWHEVVVPERELKEQERKVRKHARRMERKARVQASSIFGTEGQVPGREDQDLQPSSVSSGFI
ncbi:hypothetical protein A1O7_06537 [Cladophialophora yegresii CBS 114405]|uniref:Complex 1 LYR protein domain-containing protein n=1 Tax=Cladophialophora yegresii CBS 114405 TaxID=1182544 RepID=W9W3J1_9EURO|nr:uncharacterized protein A1O7_06537 [Cladophialophora yegresii CBS 114405]EXJ59106.1 hypothetical protein A1O7_06537 [Cladophialophora yegresii CBS 114405]